MYSEQRNSGSSSDVRCEPVVLRTTTLCLELVRILLRGINRIAAVDALKCQPHITLLLINLW